MITEYKGHDIIESETLVDSYKVRLQGQEETPYNTVEVHTIEQAIGYINKRIYYTMPLNCS